MILQTCKVSAVTNCRIRFLLEMHVYSLSTVPDWRMQNKIWWMCHFLVPFCSMVVLVTWNICYVMLLINNIQNNYRHCRFLSFYLRPNWQGKPDSILSVFNFVGKLDPCWNINPSLTDSKSSFLICASLKIHCIICFISVEGKHDKGTCVGSLEREASLSQPEMVD